MPERPQTVDDFVFWILEMVALGFVLEAVASLRAGNLSTAWRLLVAGAVFGLVGMKWSEARRAVLRHLSYSAHRMRWIVAIALFGFGFTAGTAWWRWWSQSSLAPSNIDQSLQADPLVVLIIQTIKDIETKHGHAPSATYKEVVESIESMKFEYYRAVTIVSDLQAMRHAGLVTWQGDITTIRNDTVLELNPAKIDGYLQPKSTPRK